jgi:O-antigen/teichoic acid export membrane protein
VLMLASFGMVVVANVLTGLLQGLQRTGFVLVATVPAAAILWVVGNMALSRPRPLVGLLAAQLAHGVVLTSFLGLAVARVLRTFPAQSEVTRLPWARLVRLGSWVQAGSLFALVQQHVDKIILGILVALAPVGAYDVGARVVAVAFLPASFFLSALMPALAQRETAGNSETRLDVYRRALPPYAAMILPSGGALVILAHPLLASWLGSPPEGAVFSLQCLAITNTVIMLTGIASATVRAGERVDFEAGYGALGAVLHVILSLVGLMWWGWTGVLYGSLASAICAAIFFLARVERWLGGRSLLESARAMTPSLIALAPAVVLAGLVIGPIPGPVGRPSSLASLSVGLVVFLTVYFLILATLFRDIWRSLSASLSTLGRS